jgi:hypothetical protein
VRDGGSAVEAKPGAGIGDGVMGAWPVADLDGDEVGFLVAKVAEIKRQK